MRPWAILRTILFFCATIVIWRIYYPRHEWAALVLLPLAGFSYLGSYRIALSRRRAFLAACMEKASPARRVFSGRISASLSGAATTAVIIPTTGYFSLTASMVEFVLIIGVLGVTTLALLLLEAGSARHVKALYRTSFTAPLVLAIAGLIFIPLHTWVNFRFEILPAYLRADQDLSAVLLAALGALPGQNPIISEVFSWFRIAETMALWLVSANDFTDTVPLLIILLQASFIYLSFSKLVIDLHAAMSFPERRFK